MSLHLSPETDAFAIKFKTTCGEKYWVPVDIARKLELERDEAREKVEQQRKEIVRLNGATNHAGGTPLKIALKERDEAREALEFRRELYKVQEKCLEDARRERDEAREALMKIEDLFIDGADVYAAREKMGTIARAALEETK